MSAGKIVAVGFLRAVSMTIAPFDRSLWPARTPGVSPSRRPYRDAAFRKRMSLPCRETARAETTVLLTQACATYIVGRGADTIGRPAAQGRAIVTARIPCPHAQRNLQQQDPGTGWK